MTLVFGLLIVACNKELSFEGNSISNTPLPGNTVTPPSPVIRSNVDSSIKFPYCVSCDSTNASFIDGRWSFRNYSSFLCGSITKATFLNERHSFTFTGPSSCSTDTIFYVFASFAPVVFNTDLSGISTNNVVMEYYKPNDPNKILSVGWNPKTITMTIDTFDYATNNITGRISGYAFTAKGDSSYINLGKFKAKVQ